MAVNLAKRRFKNLVAKEENDRENGPNLRKKAQDAIKKNREALKKHAKEQLERIIALNSDPRYLGPPIKEDEWVGKKTYDKILDKVKNGFLGKRPATEVDFDPETLEGNLSGRQEIVDPSALDIPAEVIAENAENAKPIQKASPARAIPKAKKAVKKAVKETIKEVKAERKEEIKEKIEEVTDLGPDGPPIHVNAKPKKSTKKYNKKG